MEAPIILSENGDVSFFDSVHAAEEYVEPIDVRNQEYVAYDRTGRRLDLRVVTKYRLRDVVEIVDREDAETAPEELGELMRTHLSALGFQPVEFDGLSLDALVHLAWTARRRR